MSLPANGTDIFYGTIDGDQVPRLDWKNGRAVGKGPNGGQGEYINQVAWSSYNSTFYKWDGNDWVTVSNVANLTEATKLYRDRDLYQENNTALKEEIKEKESIKFTPYEAAINPVGFTSVRYPKNVSTADNSDFVLFDFFDYQPPFKDNQTFSGELSNDLKASFANGWFDQTKDVRYFTNETLPQYNRTAMSAELYKRDTTGKFPQIMLYMPDDISDTLKAEWEGKAFGATSAGILSAAGAEGGIEKLKGAANVTGKSISKAPVELAASLVTNLAKGITGDTINTGDIFGGIDGVIRNPNVEVLFQKMSLRTFDLTFKLIPYNMEEKDAIKKIIQTFQRSMLPQYTIGDTEVGGKKGSENRAVEASFIKVPKVCKVTYMRGASEHPDLPTYKMCAVTDVAVNYTPDGNYAVYHDGSPVAYELKVNFMETKLLFSEEIPGWKDGKTYGMMAG